MSEPKTHYVAILRGTAEEKPEYPRCEPMNKVAVWHVAGPMERSLALNLLRRRVQEVGEPNVRLLVQPPWSVRVSVESVPEVKFVYPDDEKETSDE